MSKSNMPYQEAGREVAAGVSNHDDQPNYSQQPSEKSRRDSGTDFLLSEVETAREFLTYDVGASDKRTDLLLTIASAVGAGLVILWQAHVDATDFLYVVIVAAFSLLVIAIPTYFESLHTDISVVRHIRAINKVRKYFATQYPYITPALSLSRDLHHPRFGRVWGGNRRIQMAVITLASTVLMVAVSLLARHQASLDALTRLIAVATFLVSASILEVVARLSYWIAVRRYDKTFEEV